ncbi:MAG: hypothetical protein H7831_06670 [Magnetococcus sp. WYHC-3]
MNIQDTLRKLRLECERILEEAARNQSRFDGDAINWGHLRVVSCEYCVDEDNYDRYIVTIEEAAPDCPRLRGFVIGQLSRTEFGGKSVSIFTEW